MQVSFQVDLTNCDREPIHVPGFIQAHGFLLSIDASSRRINQISENAGLYTGKPAAGLLGKRLDELFEETNAALLNDLLNIGLRNNNFEAQNPSQLSVNDNTFDLIIHAGGNNVILEFEERRTVADSITLQKTMSTALAKIQSAGDTRQLLNQMAAMVKEITGYDRVMIYSFHQDGHGEVVAEAKNEGIEPFLHLHYPASDIPSQARELYKINLVRMIADVDAPPSPLLGISGNDAQPLDLTHSVLRAVSPIHIEYLKNMGVLASFSISLLYKKDLWGLIACHNYRPKVIDYNSRMACRFIGQLFSAALEFRTEEDQRENSARYALALQQLHDQLFEDIPAAEALLYRKTTLLDMTAASGAALFFEDKMHLLGATPDEEQVRQIALYLNNQQVPAVYHTNNIPVFLETAKASAAIASGVLLAELSPGMSEYIMWFKPEKIQTVEWAGNPQKAIVKAEDGSERLSPRKSFEKWTAEVKYMSEEWTTAEIHAAEKIREDIIQALNKKATEIRKLNDLLRIAYEELDTFTYTISHDLRTPLSSIKNYSEIILEDYSAELSADAVDLLKRVLKGTDKMSQLIKDVLHYSKVGRTGIAFKNINMKRLVGEVVEEIKSASINPGLIINIEQILDVQGDETMITQLFQNLLGNAVKYSAKKPLPVVDISSQPYKNGFILYTVADNGIGLDMKYASRIFELFRRLDNVKEYDGTGVGLAIVKRIVEKHEGKVWVESDVNSGTKFYLLLKK